MRPQGGPAAQSVGGDEEENRVFLLVVGLGSQVIFVNILVINFIFFLIFVIITNFSVPVVGLQSQILHVTISFQLFTFYKSSVHASPLSPFLLFPITPWCLMPFSLSLSSYCPIKGAWDSSRDRWLCSCASGGSCGKHWDAQSSKVVHCCVHPSLWLKWCW